MSPAKFKFPPPFETFCHNLRFSVIIQKQRKLIKVFVPGDGTSLFPDGCPQFGLWRWEGKGAQWAKSGGEAVLLQFSDSTKDPMHDFNRLFC